MQHRTAIVSGASIAGLSVAFWLRRAGWEVTVLERADAFRTGGQNIDVRGVAREVVTRMGLFDAVKAANTTETGTVLVDESGEVTAELPSDGTDGATAELEVLRGDLARVVRDAVPGGVDIRYGERIVRVEDGADRSDRTGADGLGTDGVEVTTERGTTLHADLLVVAEGVRSSTRGLVFREDEVEMRPLDITMAFGTIPRTADDDRRWRWLTTSAGRQVHLRPDPYDTIRAILAFSPAADLARADRATLMAELRRRYADVGWEAPRVLDGFATSDDVYVDDLTQVRMPTWHRGRVVLAGDAAWCVTPLGGGGASLALTSGYVLAASLSTAEDQQAALAAYEDWMRPLVDDVQGIPRGITKFAYPQTRLGLSVRRLADKVLLSAPLRPVAAKLTQVAQTEQELPELRTAVA